MKAPAHGPNSSIEAILGDGSVLWRSESDPIALQIVSKEGVTTLALEEDAAFRDFFVSRALGGGFYVRRDSGPASEISAFLAGGSSPAFTVPAAVGPSALDDTGNLIVLADKGINTFSASGTSAAQALPEFAGLGSGSSSPGESVRGDDGTWYHLRYESRTLEALDGATGAVKWQVPDEDGGPLLMGPAELVYLAPRQAENVTEALRPVDGSIAWVTQGTPMAVAADGRLIVQLLDSSGPSLLRAVGAAGEVLWTASAAPAVYNISTIVDGDGVVYSLQSSVEGGHRVVALDLSGEPLWTSPVVADGSSLVVQNLLLGTKKTLYLYSDRTEQDVLTHEYYYHSSITALGPLPLV